MPDNNPADVLGGQTPPVPTMDQTPLASRPAPAGPQVSSPTPSPTDKHTMLGRAVKHIADTLEGHRTVYTPDPNTGDIVESQVPRKPGGVFRDILLGALIGGAAGANAPQGSGPLGGFATGGAAVLKQNQENDSRAKNRAVESAGRLKTANDQDEQQDSQNNLAQAAIAQGTMSSLDLGHHIGLHNDDEVESHNNAVKVVQQAALDNGGALASVEGNGKPGNGPDMMAAYQRDPTLLQGPDGFHRLPIITYDTQGLVHKDGKWADQDGKDVDWNERATVSLVDLPNSAWGKTITLSRKAANDAAGRTISAGDPKGSVNTTFGGLYGLGLKNLQQMNNDRRALNAPIKKDTEYAGEKAKLDAIRAKADEDKTDDDRRFEEVRGPIIDKYKPKQAAPTPTQVKLETDKFNQELREKGSQMDKQNRATLLERQKSDPNRNKGVPADIVASIGDRPVPAEFPLGDKDPVYKLLDKMWGNASLDKKSALSSAASIARMKEMGKIRYYNVIDTETNAMTAANSSQLADMVSAKPGKIILATQDGTKMMAKGASIDDIQTNINFTRDAITGLDNLDARTRMKLAISLRETDPSSSISTFLQSEAGQALDESQQKAVIALKSMAENIMVMRAVQGVTGAGSDMVRQAMLDMIPSGKTPSKGYADKQFNILQRTLDQVKKGIPTVGAQKRVEPTTPVDQNANPVKPPKPDTHVFNVSAWQKANPKGDVNAAKAAAQKQGYTIQQ
jgi:hypothetical protein